MLPLLCIQPLYNKQISASQNAIKTTSGIIKCETGQRKKCAKISVNDSETFNNYFLRSAEKVATNVSYNSNIKGNIQNSICMMTKIFGNPFPKIRLTNTTANEIEKNIN